MTQFKIAIAQAVDCERKANAMWVNSMDSGPCGQKKHRHLGAVSGVA